MKIVRGENVIKKKTVIINFILLSLIFILMGCSSSTVKNVSPKTILQNNLEADFFVVDDVVYINASGIEWVMELILKEESVLGKIEKTGVKSSFTNWSATKLEVNTEIYKAEQRNDILLVKIGDKFIPYLKYVEG